jgi:conjugal transfer/type IV secretion protein DotA/TraY
VDAARAKWAYEKTLVNDETLNPMDKMVSIGHTIINTAWGALAAKGAMDATIKLSQSVAEKSIFGRVANFFTGLPSGLTESAGAFAAVYTPIFYLGIFSLLSGGIMLAYILPLLPFRLWIFGVARYIVRVMMAILAAPIWALAHIDPEGEGVGRRASQGYYVLLDLLLRPLLMVIGLLAGFMIVSILAELFSMVFHIAIKNALVGSHGGLTGLIVYIVLGSTLFISLVNIAFSTISDGINFCFEVGGMRTPQGGSPERDSHMLDKETEQSSQKTEGVIKQSASGSAPSPKPMSNNQLIKPDSSK